VKTSFDRSSDGSAPSHSRTSVQTERWCVAALCAALIGTGSGKSAGVDYLVYVASEAADKISLIRFNGSGGRVEREFSTGLMPTSIDGPHGLAMAPDGRAYYVSLAHGQPNGSVWKYSTANDQPMGRVTLGLFPATMQVSPGGDFVYVANFNLHGDRVRSSVSVVETSTMLEISRIETCVMPHGSRLDPSGTRHYSVCMMDDALVEIDTARLRVARHFIVTRGNERGGSGLPPAGSNASASHQGHGAEAPKPGDAACSPTWAQPSSDARAVFVACNGSSEIVQIDVTHWEVSRRIAAAPGVYNLATTRGGALIATNRRDQSASIFDAATGKERARIRLPRKAAHGIAVSSDDRYAFVSVEGVGAEPGAVVMIDIATGKTVASVDVAPQAGGIDFWKSESSHP
jgi:DNA-binding beta-propeller fold protein YncE